MKTIDATYQRFLWSLLYVGVFTTCLVLGLGGSMLLARQRSEAAIARDPDSYVFGVYEYPYLAWGAIFTLSLCIISLWIFTVQLDPWISRQRSPFGRNGTSIID